MDPVDKAVSSARMIAAMMSWHMPGLRTVSMFIPIFSPTDGLTSERRWLVHDGRNVPGNRWACLRSDLDAWPDEFNVHNV